MCTESNILNPDPEKAPPVDPKDEFMLNDAPTFVNGSERPVPVTPQVSWLRRTEYISGVTSSRTPGSASREMCVLRRSLVWVLELLIGIQTTSEQ